MHGEAETRYGLAWWHWEEVRVAGVDGKQMANDETGIVVRAPPLWG